MPAFRKKENRVPIVAEVSAWRSDYEIYFRSPRHLCCRLKVWSVGLDACSLELTDSLEKIEKEFSDFFSARGWLLGFLEGMDFVLLSGVPCPFLRDVQ